LVSFYKASLLFDWDAVVRNPIDDKTRAIWGVYGVAFFHSMILEKFFRLGGLSDADRETSVREVFSFIFGPE
jgi:hypothetical protein